MNRLSILLAFAVSSWIHAADPPSPPLLFQGQLIGVNFVAAPDVEDRFIPILLFLATDEYTYPVPLPKVPILRRVYLRTDVDLQTASPENYPKFLEALMPNGVRMGMDCLVSARHTNLTRDLRITIVSLEPFSATARARLLARHMRSLIDAQSIRRTGQEEREPRIKDTAEAYEKILDAFPASTPGSAEFSETCDAWNSTRSSLGGQVNGLRVSCQVTILILNALRPYADAAVHDEIDELLRHASERIERLLPFTELIRREPVWPDPDSV